MKAETNYEHLERRPDKWSKQLFIKGRSIRSYTIWLDRYMGVMSPEEIAFDREMPIEAVYEALLFCQENWELISGELESERELLDSMPRPRRDALGEVA